MAILYLILCCSLQLFSTIMELGYSQNSLIPMPTTVSVLWLSLRKVFAIFCCYVTLCTSTCIHLSELLVVLPLQDGHTALMFASFMGHEVVVEALLKAGATVDMQNKVLLYCTSISALAHVPKCMWNM